MLVACGGGGSSSPTPDAAATATRSVEQTQVAAVLTPAAAGAGSAVARPTTGGTPPSSLLIPPAPGTQPPGAPSGSAPSGTVPAGTVPAGAIAPPVGTAAPPAASSGAPTQVVKVTADDGANLRDKPDTNGEIVAKIDFGAEVPVLETNVAGADGASKWVRVSYNGKTGFIRSDLVIGPQAPSPTQPPAPTATAKP